MKAIKTHIFQRFLADTIQLHVIKQKQKNSEFSKNDFEAQIYRFFSKRASQLIFSGLCAASLLFPQVASANFLDTFLHTANAEILPNNTTASSSNSQNMVLAEANIGPDTTDSIDPSLSSVTINNAALTPKVGPLGSNLDVAEIPEGGGQITVYTVHAGDSIGSIAQMFEVSKATIINANDLSKGQALVQGMILAIPPISAGVHTVKTGETLESIAKQFKVKASDIAIYNDLDVTDTLDAGTTIIIPDEDSSETLDTSATSTQTTPAKTVTKPIKKPTTTKTAVKTMANTSPADSEDTSTDSTDPNAGPITAHPMRVNIKTDLGNALLRPIPLAISVETQGAHGLYGSAVDIAAPMGTPIHAAADGTVVLARDVGWNGGYGNYIIIMSTIDGNIVQTIYAHESKILTTAGAVVKRGDVIGLVGRTGNATGPHVHFEVHGALNPLTVNKNYTGE